MTKKTIPADELESTSTMKSVLEEISQNKNLVRKDKKRFSLRDFVWDYPLYVSKIFKMFIFHI